MKLLRQVSVNNHRRSPPPLRVPECWAFNKKTKLRNLVGCDFQTHKLIYLCKSRDLCAGTCDQRKEEVFVFSHQKKSVPGGFDSTKMPSICVLHFTTNLLSLMHLKTCQMLYKQKIHNPCRSCRHFKAPCCYSWQNGLSPSHSLSIRCVSELPVFHSDFHPDAALPLGPGEREEIALPPWADRTGHSWNAR